MMLDSSNRFPRGSGGGGGGGGGGWGGRRRRRRETGIARCALRYNTVNSQWTLFFANDAHLRASMW